MILRLKHYYKESDKYKQKYHMYVLNIHFESDCRNHVIYYLRTEFNYSPFCPFL